MALILQVLTEPRNALGKQYKKMFAMNNVSTLCLNYLCSVVKIYLAEILETCTWKISHCGDFKDTF